MVTECGLQENNRDKMRSKEEIQNRINTIKTKLKNRTSKWVSDEVLELRMELDVLEWVLKG